MLSTNSLGESPRSIARVNSAAAPSRAPPNRSPIVNSPATREETRSFPARVVITVVIAPETAGPYIVKHVSFAILEVLVVGLKTNVIGSEHENHFEELASVRWQTPLEPKQRNNSSDSDVLLEDIRDSHTGVQKFLSTLIRDGTVRKQKQVSIRLQRENSDKKKTLTK